MAFISYSEKVRLRAHCVLLFVFFLTAISVSAQVRQVDLRELVGASGMAFVGTVTEVRGGIDANGNIVTYTTFAVERAISGIVGSSLTVKQYGGESSGRSVYLAHMRYFTKGERVLALLYPPSRLGYSSPIGMNQGVWTVTQNNMVTGVTATALNGLAGYLGKYGITVKSSQSIPLASFVSLIKDIQLEGRR